APETPAARTATREAAANSPAAAPRAASWAAADRDGYGPASGRAGAGPYPYASGPERAGGPAHESGRRPPGRRPLPLPQCPDVTFRPTTATTSSDTKKIRAAVAGSPSTTMPSTAAPAAPIPTHTP
ncbi:hypothetical protein GA0115251_10911, partial [Streptomyces sp. TverLS-915]